MEDKKTKKVKTFNLSKAVKTINYNQKMEARELFFILASRLAEEVKLCPKNMVYFWDLRIEQWQLVQLKQKGTEGHEEQEESGETIDLK